MYNFNIHSVIVFIVFVNIVTKISGISKTGAFCNFNYDNTPMPSAMQLSEPLHITLNSNNYPDWSTEGPCSCKLTSREHNTSVQFDLKFLWEAEEEKCAALVLKINGHTFYSCPENTSHRVQFALKKDKTMDLDLYNIKSSRVKANINIVVNRPSIIVKCSSSSTVSIAHDFCPCIGYGPVSGVGLLNVEQVPTSKRLLVGFMAALGFIVLLAIILVIIFLIKRGYLERIFPCINQKKEEAEKSKNEIDNAYATINIPGNSFARNYAFEGDFPPRILSTPQNKSIDGIYATVDLSSGQTKHPFTSDMYLRQDLRTPNDSEVGSKYRGSSDSGLYSEISTDRPQQFKTPNHSFPGPYATSMETLQSLGPEYKFEPPAGQSSPKMSPKSKEEIEALYAKPMKKTKKKAKTAANIDKKPQHSSQELNLSSQISVEKLPEYHPRSMGSRSSSSNVVNPQLSNSRSGSVNVLYLNGNSRSQNEIYASDSNVSRGSRATIETDV